MRLVYIDEAGISKPAQEPFLVVAGVIVDADRALNGIENQIERIMERRIPQRLHAGFVFHATELFSGGKILTRHKADFIGPHEWPLHRRLEIADEIMAIPRKFNLPIAIGFLERARFPQTFAIPANWTEDQKTVAAHASAFMNCAMVAEQWMRKETTNENCLLVVENNDRARKTISDVHRYHQSKKLELVEEKERRYFPFRKIKEDPLFQPKRPASPLILADFCAYVFKRFLMRDTRYNRFFEPIRPYLVSFEESWLERQRGRDTRSVPRSRQARIGE